MQSVMHSVLFYCRTGDVRTPLSPFFRYPHTPWQEYQYKVQGPQLTSSRSGHHAGHISYPPSGSMGGVVPLHSFVDSPVDKGCGALSLSLRVGLDGASPLRGHSDLDLHKLLHILFMCPFLSLCLFSHFAPLSGDAGNFVHPLHHAGIIPQKTIYDHICYNSYCQEGEGHWETAAVPGPTPQMRTLTTEYRHRIMTARGDTDGR